MQSYCYHLGQLSDQNDFNLWLTQEYLENAHYVYLFVHNECSVAIFLKFVGIYGDY